MKTLFLVVAALLVSVVPLVVPWALAGPLTLEWSPVAGATGYDIEESIDNGATWTIKASVLPTVCTGTPSLCLWSGTTPTAGRPLYRIISKNANGRTAPQIGIWSTDTSQGPPPAIDGTAGSR